MLIIGFVLAAGIAGIGALFLSARVRLSGWSSLSVGKGSSLRNHNTPGFSAVDKQGYEQLRPVLAIYTIICLGLSLLFSKCVRMSWFPELAGV